MFKPEIIDGNTMRIETGNKSFDRYCKWLSPGAVLSQGHVALWVRPRSVTTCNGMTFPVGHLFEFDMRNFRSLPSHYREALSRMPEDVLVHELFHLKKGGAEKVVHGWVVVSKSGKVLARWNPSNRTKAQMVLDYAAKCVAEEV